MSQSSLEALPNWEAGNSTAVCSSMSELASVEEELALLRNTIAERKITTRNKDLCSEEDGLLVRACL